MLIDLISSDNFMNFNIKLAHTIGLHSAIYVNELVNIMRKAERKDKTVEGYIFLDREYIRERTTLPIEEQFTIDKKLSQIKLLTLCENLPDKIKLNLEILTTLTAEEDVDVLNKISSITKVKKVNSATTKMSQRQYVIQSLKDSINIDCAELKEAYCDWIDGVYAKPNGFLSKKAIKVFQDNLDKFTQGDLDLALKVLEIAAINGYRVVDWAINIFQKEYARDFYAQRNHKLNIEAPISQKQVAIVGEVF